jgi:DNA-directed RNA polymerase subunit RPC12/RpoP
MKFLCDRCGKKYATAEDPSPGKIYKLKCKACGHLIVVKAQAGTSTAIPAMTAAEAGAAAPEIELDIELPPAQTAASAPAPGEPTPLSDADVMPFDPPVPAAPLPSEVASAIDGVQPIPAPPPPGKDELADFQAAAAEVLAQPDGAPAKYVDLFGDGGITGEAPAKPAPAKKDDPFARAARQDAGARSAAHLPPLVPEPAPAPKPKVAQRPPPSKGAPAAPKGLPLPLIAGALVLFAVVVGFAIYKSTRKPEPPALPTPLVVAPPPKPRAPVAPPKAEPAPEPAKPKLAERTPEPRPEPKPEPRPEPARPKPVEARPVERKPEPKPAPPPEPPKQVAKPTPPPAPAPEPVEAKTETREVSLPDADQTLTSEAVQRVINANKKAFAACISSAGSNVKLDGRRVVLKLHVNSGGAVTYPTLDDQTLNSTDLGQCLKSAARLMIFPKFKGDPIPVEVPLTLSN